MVLPHRRARPAVPTVTGAVVAALVAALALTSCSQDGATIGAAGAADSTTATTAAGTSPAAPNPSPTSPTAAPTASATTSPATTRPATAKPTTSTGRAMAPGAAPAPAPPAAGSPELVDTSHPTSVVGTGTPASCTTAALVAAVAKGGIVTFDCGPSPTTITLSETLRIRNTTQSLVLDGGSRVTLSGGGSRRILYQNTCDASLTITSGSCPFQATPRLTLQRLTFRSGNSTGQTVDGGGGGAVFVRGGQLTVVDSQFADNRCDATGADLGGAAIRAYETSTAQPVRVVGSTFTGGRCSNGGALSGLWSSWSIRNSVITGNAAVGKGANPAAAGTPGGGSGGAIYTDGNTYTVRLQGCRVENNTAAEGGGAIFFVSNDRSGHLYLESSTLRGNHSGTFENYPGIFYLGSGAPVVTGSTLG